MTGRQAEPVDLLDGIAGDALNGRPAEPVDLLDGIASDASGERRFISVVE